MNRVCPNRRSAGGHSPFARVGFLVLLLSCACVSTLPAQLPDVRYDQLGVDLVRLESGSKLFGFVLDRLPDGSVHLAIERQWFHQTYPDLYAKHAKTEATDRKRVLLSLKTRLDDWLEERNDAPRLVRFLEIERNRIEDELEDLSKSIESESKSNQGSQFVVLQLSADEVNAVRPAEPESRRIAGLSFGRRIPDVTTTPAKSLLQRLEALGVDFSKEQVDLADRLPTNKVDSPREWAARQAIFEYQMRESLEYQGKGTLLIRKGEQANIGSLLSQAFSAGESSLDAALRVGAELGLPEFQQFKTAQDGQSKSSHSKSSQADNSPPGNTAMWWKDTVAKAERDGFRGVLISRLTDSLQAEAVRVDTHFFAKEAPGEWFEVVHFQEQVSTQRVDPKRLQRLRQDPQVKQALEMANHLFPTGGERIDLALKHGAATEQALEATSDRFQAFLSRQLRSLTEPLSIP